MDKIHVVVDSLAKLINMLLRLVKLKTLSRECRTISTKSNLNRIETNCLKPPIGLMCFLGQQIKGSVQILLYSVIKWDDDITIVSDHLQRIPVSYNLTLTWYLLTSKDVNNDTYCKQVCIPVGCVPPAVYCMGDGEVYVTKAPLDRDPPDRDLVDRDPTGQRTPGRNIGPETETP